MSNALKIYIAKGKPVKIDPDSLRVYEERMTVVIPEIVEDIRIRDQLAAELRFAPAAASRSEQKKD